MIKRHWHAEDVILDDGEDDAAASAEARAGVHVIIGRSSILFVGMHAQSRE